MPFPSRRDGVGDPRRGERHLWTVQDDRRSKDRRQRPTSSAMRRNEGASTDESGPSASVSTVHVRHNSRRFPGARQAGALKQRLAANVEKMASHASQAIAPGTSKTRASSEAICWEIYGGRKRAYVFNPLGKKKAVGRAVGGNVELQVIEARDDGRGPLRRVKNLAKSYLLPEGWPGSVAKGYAPYMGWRAIQHFFGGAMGVFTTRSLLASLGVGRPGTSAAAINWVLKDGAGRFGKMLFARQGRKLDGELKQYRLAGNVLMEVGAGMELATVWCPQFFLPLACLANLTKQVAAVTASATRAPIYKSLALEYNLGDITAKGESVGNLTDLMGTAVGIYLAKKNPATWVAFAGLSSGFLLASYLEVKSVRLPYLNRARMQIAARTFLESGKVPGVDEANKREKLWPVTPPWVAEKQPVIGATVAEAFENPDDLRRTLKLFDKSKYVMAYRPEKRQPYVLLKEGACQKDLLKGCFHAFLLQHILEERVAALDKERGSVGGIQKWQRERVVHSSETVHQALKDSCHQISSRFSDFREEAVQHGWNMDDAMINAGEARIIPRHGSIWVQSKLAKINEILHQQ